MQINPNINDVIFNLSKEKKTVQNQSELLLQPQKTIELPDIRSSQILLPDNKIYVPKSVAPSNFNSQHLSVELPEYLKQVPKDQEQADRNVAVVSANFGDAHLYKNTKNNSLIIRAEKNNFSENGVLNSSEVTHINALFPEFATRYIKDYEHNSETEIKISKPLSREIAVQSMTTVHRNENNDIVKIEEYTPSCITGVYNITETDEKGNKHDIVKAYQDENGNTFLEKHLKSLDGTKTEYLMEYDSTGNHKKLFCQITDSEGKVLSTIDRTYDKQSDNVVYSSVNNNSYTAIKTQDGAEILNHQTKEVTPIREQSLAMTQTGANIISKVKPQATITYANPLEQMLGSMPADTLLTLNDNIRQIIPVKDDLDSTFIGALDFLLCNSDDFTINHELGHSKDARHFAKNEPVDLKSYDKTPVLANNDSFKLAYFEEKAAFVKEFPDFKEDFIKYFIVNPENAPDRGKKEVVAESNAINNFAQPTEHLAMRTQMLQQYFPRTIAELTKMMNPLALAENTQQ